MRWRICGEGGDSGIFNCGYGKGYSVLEVINAVKKAHGSDFKVNMGPRRAGDPAAIVAGADRVRAVLGWQPKYDDLDFIVNSAMAWEQRLAVSQRGLIGAAFGGFGHWLVDLAFQPNRWDSHGPPTFSDPCFR